MPPPSPDACIADPAANRIGCYDEDKANNAHEQINRRRVAVVALHESDPVHIGADNVSGFISGRVVEQKHFLEPDLKHLANIQNEQNDNRRANPRQSDMPQLAESSCSVHVGRFVQHRVERRERRQINDRLPPGMLPNFRSDIYSPEPFGLHHHIRIGRAEPFQQLVENAPSRRQEHHYHRCDDHVGNKVRQIADGLHEALEERMLHLVQQHGQHNRGWEPERQIVHTEQQGVAHQLHEIGILKKHPVIPPSDPSAFLNAFEQIVVLERDDDTEHRGVLEHDII